MKKLVSWVLGFIVGIFVVVTAISGAYLYVALHVGNRDFNEDFAARSEHMHEIYDGEATRLIDSLYSCHALRDTFFVSDDGERQHAMFVQNDSAKGRTAVVVHGYRSRLESMLPLSTIYYRMGYNVLLPDLHAHGLSDGKMIQMGWKDRLDVKAWVNRAPGIFHSDSLKVVVHGVSMGAATTMCLSGEDDAPQSIRCYVEDCGYSSVMDEFSVQGVEQYGKVTSLFLKPASLLCKVVLGWSFTEASAVKQVSKCQKPMFFIHGSVDTYVPTSMVYKVHDAKPGKKRLWIATASSHARSFSENQEMYARQVTDFVSPFME